MADLYDILLGQDPDAAAEAARTIAAALKRDRTFALMATATGNKNFIPVGQQLSGSADKQDAELTSAVVHAAQNKRESIRDALEAAYKERMAGATERNVASQEQARRDAANFHRDQLDQDAWTLGIGHDGTAVALNKKTGEVRAVGPQATPGAPALPPGYKLPQLDHEVQQLGKDMEPLAQMQGDLATLQAAAKKGDVAGFGPIAGHVPDFAASDEGITNRQAAGRLMAAIILEKSGKVATESEVKRLLSANGLGQTATDAQLRLGIDNLKTMYDQLLALKKAKYNPAVVDTYSQRGGFTSAAPGAPAAPAAPRRIKVDAQGNIVP